MMTTCIEAPIPRPLTTTDYCFFALAAFIVVGGIISIVRTYREGRRDGQ